jgi:Tfp pilus assembly protein PilZ
MPKQPDPKAHSKTRSSPRAAAALEVEVEVAGKRRKVRLVSRDIGAGGIFLRTDEPAELWTKVKLVLSLPTGGTFEVGGEVVRSVPKKKPGAKGHPAGMAVAFDEVSRGKRKELVALVLDLCAQRPSKEEKKKDVKDTSPPPKEPPKEPEAPAKDDPTDALLDELDDLIDSVENEIEVEVEDQPESLDEDDEREASAEIVIEDVEVIDLEMPEEEPAAKPPPKPPSRPPSKPPSRPKPKPEEEPAKPEGSVDDLRAALAEYKGNLKGDTYYDILEIDMKSSAKDIEAAYQKLLGRLKPPGSPDSLPAELLRELSGVLGKVRKAFAILSKPDRKRAYDFLIDNEVEDF